MCFPEIVVNITRILASLSVSLSSKVVGYQNVQPEYSYHMLGMPFTGCSGDEVMIADIKGEFETFDNIQHSFVDDEGYVDFDVYEYYAAGTRGKGSLAGWYLDSDLTEDTIGNGHAVWFIKDSSYVETVGSKKNLTLALTGVYTDEAGNVWTFDDVMTKDIKNVSGSTVKFNYMAGFEDKWSVVPAPEPTSGLLLLLGVAGLALRRRRA